MIAGRRQLLEKPLTVTVELTYRCNVRCIHCYSSAGMSGFDPPTKQMKSILHRVLDVEPFFILFTGGEPFVRSDLDELLMTVHERMGRLMPEITIATNGQLINTERGKKVLDTISAINDDVGLPAIGVYVSLHGSRPEIHDKIMGVSGAYQRAISAIQTIKAKGNIAYGIGCTPMKQNYRDLENLVQRGLELEVPVMNFSQFVAVGRGSSGKENDLTPDQYQAFVEWFVHRRQDLEGKMLLVTHEPLEVVVNPAVADLDYYFGCPAGWLSATVEPDGTIYPCPLAPIRAGNIFERELGDVWLNDRTFERFRDRDNIRGVCGPCEYKWVCGGCRGTALAYEGTPYGSDPRCWHYTERGRAKIRDIHPIESASRESQPAKETDEHFSKILDREVDNETLRRSLRLAANAITFKGIENGEYGGLPPSGTENWVVERPPNPYRWNFSNNLHVFDRVTRFTIALDKEAGLLYQKIGSNGSTLVSILSEYPQEKWSSIMGAIQAMAQANIILLRNAREPKLGAVIN